MGEETSGLTEAGRQYRRILGRLSGNDPGPSLVVMTGIHGNEPTGVLAALRVLRWIEEHRPPLAGDAIFLAGNLPALRDHRRFIDLDLNRQWTPDKVAEFVTSQPHADDPVEHGEQRELLGLLREVVHAARGPIYFMDHHTSSADGAPFVTIGDTMRNRRFALRFPLPLILGLEEQVDGALLELLNNHGFITMGVEAGRHDDEASIDRHEAVLWLALVHSGILAIEHAPDLEPLCELLRAASRDVPPVVEVRYRHAITGEDAFCMQPGYVNFRHVCEGEILAHDRSGPIDAPEDGLILLPLYQGQGDDGFFVSRQVLPFWLRVSAVLRKLQLSAMVRFLPGVQHLFDPEVLIVNTRVARVYPLEVFHLFGFRKVRQVGDNLVVSRRRYDTQAPAQVSF